MTRIDMHGGAGRGVTPPGVGEGPTGLRLHRVEAQTPLESTLAETGRKHALAVLLENLTATETAINDADFAARTASVTRGAILAQAQTILPSLANAPPQHVLALLR